MPVSSKESMEALIKEVLEMQKDLKAFINSKTDKPEVAALAMQTACSLLLDDYDAGSPTLSIFTDMAPRMNAIVDLGHEAVLKTLNDGNYEEIFGVSVELGALEYLEEECDEDIWVEGTDVTEHDVN